MRLLEYIQGVKKYQKFYRFNSRGLRWWAIGNYKILLNLFPAIPNGGTAKGIKLEKTCSVIPNGGGTELLQFIKNYCRKYSVVTNAVTTGLLN